MDKTCMMAVHFRTEWIQMTFPWLMDKNNSSLAKIIHLGQSIQENPVLDTGSPSRTKVICDGQIQIVMLNRGRSLQQ